MAYTLKSRKLDELADVSTVPQINNKHIAPEGFPIPPLDEQREIVAFLDGETAKLDALTAEAEPSDFLAYRDADGRVADFHSTRHTYISGIVAGGAPVKTAQELARHSTPVLTIGRYSHARLHDLTGALDALPSVTTAPTAPQSANGTEGIEPSARRGRNLGYCRRLLAKKKGSAEP